MQFAIRALYTMLRTRPTIDCMTRGAGASRSGRMAAILQQLDKIPDRQDAFDPLDWGSDGQPA